MLCTWSLFSTLCCTVQKGQASCSSIVQVLNRITGGHRASLFYTQTHTQTHKNFKGTPKSMRTHHLSDYRIKARTRFGQACRYCVIMMLSVTKVSLIKNIIADDPPRCRYLDQQIKMTAHSQSLSERGDSDVPCFTAWDWIAFGSVRLNLGSVVLW